MFDVSKETKDSSMDLFKTAFPDGFAWELLELLSGISFSSPYSVSRTKINWKDLNGAGPPKVSFTWRHWARWEGPYRGNEPTGELLELFGSSVVEVDENLKIIDLQVFFDPHPLLGKLMRRKDTADDGIPRCPVQHWIQFHWSQHVRSPEIV